MASREETKRMIEVMQAYVDGAEIEWRGVDKRDISCWRGCDGEPIWEWVHNNYRVKITKPSINWDHVAPEYKYLVKTRRGDYELYAHLPRVQYCELIGGDDWSCRGGGPFLFEAKNVFASLVPGTCDWRDSLVCRPGHEEQV